MTHSILAWAEGRELEPLHIDCSTAVMLKILDGKCKMKAEEKVVMAALYDALKGRSGKLLDQRVHALIETARAQPEPAILEQVYEQRVFAETMISRPVMKAFKAMLREEGVLGG